MFSLSSIPQFRQLFQIFPLNQKSQLPETRWTGVNRPIVVVAFLRGKLAVSPQSFDSIEFILTGSCYAFTENKSFSILKCALNAKYARNAHKVLFIHHSQIEVIEVKDSFQR